VALTVALTGNRQGVAAIGVGTGLKRPICCGAVGTQPSLVSPRLADLLPTSRWPECTDKTAAECFEPPRARGRAAQPRARLRRPRRMPEPRSLRAAAGARGI
jgi:hypothetical protein